MHQYTGSTIEEALQSATAELGRDITVVRARRVTSRRALGFGARVRFEVDVVVGEGAGAGPDRATGPVVAGEAPPSGPFDGVLANLIDNIERLEADHQRSAPAERASGDAVGAALSGRGADVMSNAGLAGSDSGEGRSRFGFGAADFAATEATTYRPPRRVALQTGERAGAESRLEVRRAMPDGTGALAEGEAPTGVGALRGAPAARTATMPAIPAGREPIDLRADRRATGRSEQGAGHQRGDVRDPAAAPGHNNAGLSGRGAVASDGGLPEITDDLLASLANNPLPGRSSYQGADLRPLGAAAPAPSTPRARGAANNGATNNGATNNGAVNNSAVNNSAVNNSAANNRAGTNGTGTNGVTPRGGDRTPVAASLPRSSVLQPGPRPSPAAPPARPAEAQPGPTPSAARELAAPVNPAYHAPVNPPYTAADVPLSVADGGETPDAVGLVEPTTMAPALPVQHGAAAPAASVEVGPSITAADTAAWLDRWAATAAALQEARGWRAGPPASSDQPADQGAVEPIVDLPVDLPVDMLVDLPVVDTPVVQEPMVADPSRGGDEVAAASPRLPRRIVRRPEPAPQLPTVPKTPDRPVRAVAHALSSTASMPGERLRRALASLDAERSDDPSALPILDLEPIDHEVDELTDHRIDAGTIERTVERTLEPGVEPGVELGVELGVDDDGEQLDDVEREPNDALVRFRDRMLARQAARDARRAGPSEADRLLTPLRLPRLEANWPEPVIESGREAVTEHVFTATAHVLGDGRLPQEDSAPTAAVDANLGLAVQDDADGVDGPDDDDNVDEAGLALQDGKRSVGLIAATGKHRAHSRRILSRAVEPSSALPAERASSYGVDTAQGSEAVANLGEPQWSIAHLEQVGLPAVALDALAEVDLQTDADWMSAVELFIRENIPPPVSKPSETTGVFISGTGPSSAIDIVSAGLLGFRPGYIFLDGKLHLASSIELMLAIRSCLPR